MTIQLLLLFFTLANTLLFSTEAPTKPAGWDRWLFHQKIAWRASHLDPRVPYGALVDKIKVKEVVQNDMKSAHTFFATDDPSLISMQHLPRTFMMKSNNASGRGILVKDGMVMATKKREKSFKPIPCTDDFLRAYATTWLHTLYAENNELQYALVKPMIFFEEYIEDISTEIELYFFNGKARIITLFFIDGYLNNPMVSYYDEQWNIFDIEHPSFTVKKEHTEKPAYIDDLIAFGELFAKNFDHVRVDFFIKGNDIYFGEFTFTTGGGCKLNHLNSMARNYWDFPSTQGSMVTPHLHDALIRTNSLDTTNPQRTP